MLNQASFYLPVVLYYDWSVGQPSYRLTIFHKSDHPRLRTILHSLSCPELAGPASPDGSQPYRQVKWHLCVLKIKSLWNIKSYEKQDYMKRKRGLFAKCTPSWCYKSHLALAAASCYRNKLCPRFASPVLESALFQLTWMYFVAGELCEEKLDFCAQDLNPCQHDSKCILTPKGYKWVLHLYCRLHLCFLIVPLFSWMATGSIFLWVNCAVSPHSRE